MTLLIRFVLISIIVYLLIKNIAGFFTVKDEPRRDHQDYGNGKKSASKGVSKDVGEYVDYEEVD